jgi:hypothetical protein
MMTRAPSESSRPKSVQPKSVQPKSVQPKSSQRKSEHAKPGQPGSSSPKPQSVPKPKSSSTDDYAKQIARAIAKGRPPPFSDDFDDYCENAPREIFAAFTGAARYMPPAGKDEALAFGYVFVLQRLLEHLRYRTDSGYADAAGLIADFQAHVVAKVEAGEVDRRMLALVGGALHQSKIPASPEFVAASIEHGVDDGDDELLPADIRVAVGEIFEACGDPFMAVSALFESSHALPAEGRGALAEEMARAEVPAARSATVLLLLDADQAVRHTVANALGQVAASLSPADVRRMIAMRNWRPESERVQVDALIRKARTAGIACAQSEPGSIATAIATSIDGSRAQVFMLVSPAGGRKMRASSVLTKGGIADAWSTEPGSHREIETGLASMRKDVPTLPVSRTYVDRAMAHNLALMTERGDVPPLGLLQVAETIGGVDWQPARLNVSKTLAGLIADVPKEMREPAALTSVLRTSGEPADVREISLSWYEDDPEVAQAIKGVRGRRAKLASYLLQTVIGRRRDRWTEIVLHTALWMREAPAEAGLSWRELALVAQALREGRDMNEIGLMRDVAMRTITVLRSAGGREA